MDNPWIFIAFLSVFHILGGAAVGIALRDVRLGDKPNMMLLIWGLLFGGLPLAAAIGSPIILPFQLGELILAGGSTFFFWDRMQELLEQTGVVVILLAGVFFLVGCGAVGLLVQQREFLTAFLFGLTFGGAGLGGLVYGIRRTLNPPVEKDEDWD
jgi:hypothetical protein